MHVHCTPWRGKSLKWTRRSDASITRFAVILGCIMCYTQVCVDWWTSVHLYFLETLALQVVLFILIHGTAFFPISQISCKMFLQLFLFGPTYFGCLFCPCPNFKVFVFCPLSCPFFLSLSPHSQTILADGCPPWVCFARGLLLLKGNSFSSPLPNACSWGSSDNSGFSF